jgi:hypothetical protein
MRRGKKDGIFPPNLTGNLTHLTFRDVDTPFRPMSPFLQKDQKTTSFFNTKDYPYQFGGINEKLVPDPSSQEECIDFHAKKRIADYLQRKEEMTDPEINDCCSQQSSRNYDDFISFREFLFVIAIFVTSIIILFFKFANEMRRNFRFMADAVRMNGGLMP